uniref:Tyrosine-protein kinase ephrin type A/B receptor-like domain-containing protein n=1 Tax=Biomphalaria glabrata TaxID=6526 RepID=A0A2C9K7X9_BIOGL
MGHELVPPGPKQIKCGLPTNYTWSHQTKDNPLGKIPQCSKAKPPSNQTVSVKYKCIGCPPATSSPAKQIINSTKNSLKTSNVCGKKTQCHVKTVSSKQGRKRSTESMYLVVTLELDLTDENRKNISHDEAETLIREFETSAVKLFNSSQEIFQLKVDDTQFNGYIESAEAEVICHEGSGFYNGMCVDCPEGTYSLGNGSCFLCNKGYYQEEPRQSQCQPCPEGLTTSGMGSVYKTECQKNPPTYEDIFWWVSDDEEIFKNLNDRRNTNDKVKFISGEHSFYALGRMKAQQVVLGVFISACELNSTAYAPTLCLLQEDKDKFYEDLKEAIANIPQKEHMVLLGDFNAREEWSPPSTGQSGSLSNSLTLVST